MVNYISINWRSIEQKYIVFCFAFFDDKEGVGYSPQESESLFSPVTLNGFQLKILDDIITFILRLLFVKKTGRQPADDLFQPIVKQNIRRKCIKMIKYSYKEPVFEFNNQLLIKYFYFKLFMLKFGFT